MYGGTSSSKIKDLPGKGLSPRVRGNRPIHMLPAISVGSIPACTGEPRSLAERSAMEEVYPRVYGGTSSKHCPTCPARGLSPRVRGNLQEHGHAIAALRSIPACTGEPEYGHAMPVRLRVYPRVYGGTAGRVCRDAKRTGLSPRVRGNLKQRSAITFLNGSIPACTGEPG